MFNYSNNGITVASIIDIRRATIDNLYPIKIRVTYRRVRKYYSTGKNLSQYDWENLPVTKSKKQITIRRDIQNSFDKVKNAVQQLEHENDFSFEKLNCLLGKGLANNLLNTAFQAKIESLFDENRIGTHNYYKDSLKTIEDFAGKNISFDSITATWLKKFEKHLLDSGRNYTTIGMRCRAIRAIMNEALQLGLIKEKQYPFGRGKYEIPTGRGRKMALSLQQIKMLVNYTDGFEGTEHYRDLWFFSYLCNGINFADLVTMKYSNIQNDEICFMRTKTVRTSKVKKEICAVITPEMQAIIDKWGNPDKQPDNYVFGFLQGGETAVQIKAKTRDVISRCNKYLRKIGKAIGIEGISTYTARHSFATVLKRSGTNIAYISESLGHSDLKTTENYLASFEREEREKNAKLLTDFGN
jgi:integrase